MKLPPLQPQDTVLWPVQHQAEAPLRDNISTDILIVGGGMAGLMAAQRFHNQGHKVVLIEKNHCGAGATGKSSGFITPDSELSLSDMVDAYGITEGKKLWEFINSGVVAIKKNILDHQLPCDYQVQDTLILASSEKDFSSIIKAEHDARNKALYQSTLHSHEQLSSVLGSQGYHGGISYGETFGINGYDYCNNLKKVLISQGVTIYEETPMIELQDQLVRTPHGSIKAEHIVVCIDHALGGFDSFRDKVYHAQTFLMASAPLTDKQIQQIFPDRPMMVWDTELIYNYFRLTGDNRLLLGGSSLWSTYAKTENHNNTTMMKQLISYFDKKFPEVNAQFEYMWPGLIGISKNLYPIAGYDQDMPSVYYISAAAGLPWAAALGIYSAECITHAQNPFNKELSPYRPQILGPLAQKFLGTRLAFALSNFLSVKSM